MEGHPIQRWMINTFFLYEGKNCKISYIGNKVVEILNGIANKLKMTKILSKQNQAYSVAIPVHGTTVKDIV
jgi:hypothetical protein